MSLDFDNPKNKTSIIKVLGVGGGGSNAVNHMFSKGIEGVDFIVCNTDEQALETSIVPIKVRLGPNKTNGLGAGNKPEVGRDATIESIEEIKQILSNNTKMLFITAGMGGGTGTGGAPEIARVAKELGILTVGIITTPFKFEGKRRMNQAQKGVEEFRKSVDTLVVISNDRLREMYGDLKISDAFSKADDVLTTAAKGIAEIITIPGYVNVDFQDVNTVMREGGVAIMGIGVSEGENRAVKAAQSAINTPLLNNGHMDGARNVLLNITSGSNEVTMDEIGLVTDFVQESIGNDCEIIWGNCNDDNLGEKLSITIIATGFENLQQDEISQFSGSGKIVHQLEETTPAENIVSNIVKPMPKNTVELELNPLQYQHNEPVTNETSGEEEMKLTEKPMVSSKVVDDFEEDEVSDELKALKKNIEVKKRLRNLSLKLSTPRNINEMEKQPAYKRRNVELTDAIPSDESHHSEYSVGKDFENDNNKLNKKNLYLHNPPD